MLCPLFIDAALRHYAGDARRYFVARFSPLIHFYWRAACRLMLPRHALIADFRYDYCRAMPVCLRQPVSVVMMMTLHCRLLSLLPAP